VGDENTKVFGTSVILNWYPPASSILRDSVGGMVHQCLHDIYCVLDK